MVEIKTGDASNGAVIAVVGVGGCGCNAVNRMVTEGVSGVEFVAVNTDQQALEANKAPTHIRIGDTGLGAGAKPDVGQSAAEDTIEDLQAVIQGCDMVIVTAGMGGGTGTGAAPVVAKLAKDMDILTLAIVTTPFAWEGKMRMNNATSGVDKLKECVDAIIVIPNQRLVDLCDKKTKLNDGLKLSDDVLQQAIVGITDMIQTTAMINLDFKDVETVMKDKGTAHIGIGRGKGDDRAIEAVQAAVESPLLQSAVETATDLIVYISGDVSMYDTDAIGQYVIDVVGSEANVITGLNPDDEYDDEVIVTVIATGIKPGAVIPGMPTAAPKVTTSQAAQSGLGFLGGMNKAAAAPTPGVVRAAASTPAQPNIPASVQSQVSPAAPTPVQVPPSVGTAPIPNLRTPQAPPQPKTPSFDIPALDWLKKQ
ncbi:MAG: cell division protein FtsZ [Lachnospiraceae bacterium]|nr:cell division protein FtsZ [Lachnospiraceae bacterium]